MSRKDYTGRDSGGAGSASGRGYRAGQLASRRRSQQRLARLIIVFGLLAAALLFAGITLLMRQTGSGPAEAVMPAVGGAIVMSGTDEEGALSQLLVLLPAGEDGWQVFTLLPRTVVEVPGYGFVRLDDALADGGKPLLDEALASLFGTGISGHIEFDYAALSLLVSRTAAINFSASQPLATVDGSVELAAGDNPAGADRALDILRAAPGDASAGPELQALFFRGLHDALAALPEAERQAAATDFAERVKSDISSGEVVSLAALLLGSKGATGIWPLPVTLVEGGSWYLEPVPAELQAIIGGGAGTRTLVEIRNGTSAAGVVEAAAARLEPLGFELSLIPDASGVEFDYTRINCGSEALKQGNSVQEALGRGTIIKDDNLEKNRITVIIGRDLVSAGP